MSWWVRLEHADGKTSWLGYEDTLGKSSLVATNEAGAHDFVKHSTAEAALEKYGQHEGVWGFLVDAKDAPSNLIESKTFTCPNCGGHAFGTTGDLRDPNVVGEGHCHGYIAATRLSEEAIAAGAVAPSRTCGFSWPRTDANDAKYFKGTGSFSPRVQVAQAISRLGG